MMIAMWPNLQKSTVHTSNFSTLELEKSSKIYRNCTTTIPLLSLKISSLYTTSCGFYGSPCKWPKLDMWTMHIFHIAIAMWHICIYII